MGVGYVVNLGVESGGDGEERRRRREKREKASSSGIRTHSKRGLAALGSRVFVVGVVARSSASNREPALAGSGLGGAPLNPASFDSLSRMGHGPSHRRRLSF